MPTDLESRLRSGLAAEAATVALPDDMPVRVQRRQRQLAQRRGVLRLAAAAVTVVVLTSAMLIGPQQSDGPSERSASEPPPAAVAGSSAWRALPDAPIGDRFQHAAVWTGDEMVVFGGHDSPGQRPSDAAAYNPASDSWRVAADPPAVLRGSPVAVWTGQEVVGLNCGSPCDESGGAAYDPATDQWRDIAAPVGILDAMTTSITYAVWTGDAVLVVGPPPDDGQTLRAAAALYDPRSDEWSTLPDAPDVTPVFADSFWTGEELIVIGPEDSSSAGPGEKFIAMALDPVTASWRSLPAPPLRPRDRMVAAWTGTEVVLGGGGSGAEGTEAVAYDPATDSWRELAPAPVGFTGNFRYRDIAIGQQVIAFDNEDPAGRPLILDAATGTWTFAPATTVPELIDPEELPGREDVPLVSTGSVVLVWGGAVITRDAAGIERYTRALGDGMAFDPSAVG